MYEEEFERLKTGFANIGKHINEAEKLRLTNELETLLSATLDNATANRFLAQVNEVAFYSSNANANFVANLRAWYDGTERIIAIIKSIEYSIRITESSRVKHLGSISTRKHSIQEATKSVFIVHGQDHSMLRDVDAFVRRIGISPLVLIDEPSQSKTVIEKFEDYSEVPFAIVLLSPDDIGRSFTDPPGAEKRRPRLNAVLEAGFFIGKLGRTKVSILVDSSIHAETEYPSDLGGVIPIYYRRDSDWKLKLIQELKAAGIEYDASKI